MHIRNIRIDNPIPMVVGVVVTSGVALLAGFLSGKMWALGEDIMKIAKGE